MKRTVLVFGGPHLRGVEWTWFYTATSRFQIQLHGHPGDRVPIVTQAEAEALRKELWHGVESLDDPRCSDIRGMKLMYDRSPHGAAHDAEAVVRRGQATIETENINLRAYLGLTTPSKGGQDNGDEQ